ncbi:STY0301 family protein [Rhizobium sp. FKY42]|uniref:STY0301 family protein n=1 Tax=Rhizobium sp. FKY42 TaxID=2562310 RepID=UPI0010C0C807|nr:STY0301 family protein [Rhizobium sp. FKY42]
MNKPAIVLGFVSLFAASTAHASDPGCPGRASDPLLSIELFDGLVADNVVLAPDQSSGSATRGKAVWQVSSVYKEGRTLTIACRYRSSEKPLMIEIKQKVSTCTQQLDMKTGGTFTCK